MVCIVIKSPFDLNFGKHGFSATLCGFAVCIGLWCWIIHGATVLAPIVVDKHDKVVGVDFGGVLAFSDFFTHSCSPVRAFVFQCKIGK